MSDIPGNSRDDEAFERGYEEGHKEATDDLQARIDDLEGTLEEVQSALDDIIRGVRDTLKK